MSCPESLATASRPPPHNDQVRAFPESHLLFHFSSQAGSLQFPPHTDSVEKKKKRQWKCIWKYRYILNHEDNLVPSRGVRSLI